MYMQSTTGRRKERTSSRIDDGEAQHGRPLGGGMVCVYTCMYPDEKKMDGVCITRPGVRWVEGLGRGLMQKGLGDRRETWRANEWKGGISNTDRDALSVSVTVRHTTLHTRTRTPLPSVSWLRLSALAAFVCARGSSALSASWPSSSSSSSWLSSSWSRP